MNLLKLTAVLSLTGFAACAMANEVSITNTSKHTIPVKYQFAYHNPGQPVVLKEVSEAILHGNGKIRVNIPESAYKHAGNTILGVKNPKGEWVTLPDSARQFDGNPGCWMSTNAQKTRGNINIAEYLNSDNHGRITCNTLPQ